MAFSFPLSLASAAVTVAVRPRLWILLVIPLVIALAAYVSLVWGAFSFRGEILSMVVTHSEAWYWSALEWIVFLVNLIVCGFIAWLVSAACSGFFIELFVERALVHAGLRPLENDTVAAFVRSTVRGLKESAVRAMLGIGLALIFIVTSFVPVLWIFPAVLSACLLGFDLFHLPFLLLGIPNRERNMILRKHKLSVFIMGAWMAALFAVPFAGMFFMPLGYFVACRRMREWENAPVIAERLV